VASGKNVRKLKIVRVFRVLRLMKLLRVLRTNRLLTRYRDRLSVPYSHLELVKFITILLLMSHWMACIWGLVALSEEPCTVEAVETGSCQHYSWLAVLQQGKHHGALDTPFARYSASIHFSIMTITSIGYGDVSPQSVLEYYVCAVMMLIGGGTWAYIIGSACGVVSNLDEQGIRFRQTMDHLNFMIKDTTIPDELGRRLRSYFLNAFRLELIQGYRQLMDRMSEELRGEVAIATTGGWVARVWFFREVSDDFIIQLAMQLMIHFFAPREHTTTRWSLNVMNRGMAAMRGKVLIKGCVWGLDVILDTEELADLDQAFCFTFCEVYAISKSVFSAVQAKHRMPLHFRISKAWVMLQRFVELGHHRDPAFLRRLEMSPSDGGKQTEGDTGGFASSDCDALTQSRLGRLDSGVEASVQLAHRISRLESTVREVVDSLPSALETAVTAALAKHHAPGSHARPRARTPSAAPADALAPPAPVPGMLPEPTSAPPRSRACSCSGPCTCCWRRPSSGVVGRRRGSRLAPRPSSAHPTERYIVE